MKLFVIYTALLLLGACGLDHPAKLAPADQITGAKGADGGSCRVVQTNTGATINCDDGSIAVITNGISGARGVDGSSCRVTKTYKGVLITCQDGSFVLIDDYSSDKDSDDDDNHDGKGKE